MKYKTSVDFGPMIRGILAYEVTIPRMTRNDFENVELGFNRHYATRRQVGNSFTFERSEGFENFKRFDAFSSVDGGTVTMAMDEAEGAIALHGTGLYMAFRIRAVMAITAFLVIAGWMVFPRIEFWGWVLICMGLVMVQSWFIMRSMDEKLARWIKGATLH